MSTSTFTQLLSSEVKEAASQRFMNLHAWVLALCFEYVRSFVKHSSVFFVEHRPA